MSFLRILLISRARVTSISSSHQFRLIHLGHDYDISCVHPSHSWCIRILLKAHKFRFVHLNLNRFCCNIWRARYSIDVPKLTNKFWFIHSGKCIRSCWGIIWNSISTDFPRSTHLILIDCFAMCLKFWSLFQSLVTRIQSTVTSPPISAVHRKIIRKYCFMLTKVCMCSQWLVLSD